MNENHQFMVDFTLPEEMNMQFMSLIPQQRLLVNDLFSRNILLTYTLSLDRKKLWATLIAETELEVIEVMESLPLTSYMSYEIHPLMFNEIVQESLPSFSLN